MQKHQLRSMIILAVRGSINMKQARIIFAILIITLCTCCTFVSVSACTAIAVYSDNTLYGFNFDYPPVDMRFDISRYNNMKVFSTSFNRSNNYEPNLEFNEEGLFGVMLMVYPEEQGQTYLSANEIFMPTLVSMVRTEDRTEDILKNIQERKVVQYANVTLHDIFADIHGNTVIIEAKGDKNSIIKNDKNFTVMTNFYNSSYEDTDLEDIQDVGSERYKIAYKYINENIDKFDVESAFECLSKVVQKPSFSSWPTQYSLVMDPVNKDIYFTIARDFDKVWKISLENETIETYIGFDEYTIAHMPINGFTLSELENSNLDNFKTYEQSKSNNTVYIITIVTGVLVLTAVIALILIKKRKKSNTATR